MNARRLSLLLIGMCLSLSFAEQASAYYAAHMGRWLTRDPIGQTQTINENFPDYSSVLDSPSPTKNRNYSKPTADYDAGSMNLYEYVGSAPTFWVDPLGLKRRICQAFGHGYIECQDSDGTTTELHFGPGILGQPGYYCSPYKTFGGCPITPWKDSTDEEDAALICQWRCNAHNVDIGAAYPWNPVNNCWVPVLWHINDGIRPKPAPPAPRPPSPPVCYHCCFVEGTQVLMADGSSKPIESVQLGEEVLSYDFDKKCMVPRTVCLRDNPTRENIVDLRLSGGKTISSSSDHPYWVQGKGWCSFDPSAVFSYE